MNRRGFFQGMLAAACTAVARAYVPAALATSALVAEPPAKSITMMMLEAMKRMPADGDVGGWFFYAHPDTLAKLKAIALAKPNRWQRRQRRLASR